MNKLEFLIGSDPEIMVRKGNTIGSVAGLLGCDKWNKLAMPNGINLQEDNVLVEFDIPPCTNYSDFDRMIVAGMDMARDAVAKHGFELAEKVSSHVFSPSEVAAFPEAALVFGCEPDFNAVTGEMNARPVDVDPGLRSAGGHLHFGVNGLMEINPMKQRHTAIMCDYFLGLPSLLMDSDTRRRQLYGKASAYRPKAYGIEYRTLSNFWIFENETRKFVYEQAEKVVEAMCNEELMRMASMFDPDIVANIINTNDQRMADQIIVQLGIA